MTSNWIYAYYQAIQGGEVTVGRWIRLWYEYIVRGLQAGAFSFSAKKANRAIRFVEGFCRHHEGAKAPQLIRLELWQKAMLSVIFGILDRDGRRQFREAVLIVGRKNGKTLFAAAIAEYMTFIDGEYGARIYFCAPKLDQARLCFDAYYQMMQKEPELSALAKKRRTDIYVPDSNSSAMPLAFSARKSDGLNPHLAVCDEIAAWHGDAGLKQYEVLKSALGARSQPLILSISTAGYENDSIYDELMRRCTSVLCGSSKETRLAPFLYMIDDVDRWADIDELAKANPNLGVSVTVDYLLEEIAVAEGSPSKRVEFLTKYCNVKQNSSMAWFTAQQVKDVFSEASYTLDDFRGCYALAGLDLSQTMDLTAAALLIEREGRLWAFCHFWLPHDRLREATERDGVQYEAYIRRGYLTLSGDAMVDYRDVFDWFTRLIEEHEIYPLKVGFDRWSSQYLVQDLKAYGFHMDSVSQGFNLTGVEDDLEGLIREGQLRSAEDNDLLKLHLLGAAQQMESNTAAHPRKKLIKMDKYTHVDGTAALLDALCMRHVYWEELGDQLRNAG